MTEIDLIPYCEECGLADGARAAPYRPPLTPGISADCDDAYRSAYFYALSWSSLAERVA